MPSHVFVRWAHRDRIKKQPSHVHAHFFQMTISTESLFCLARVNPFFVWFTQKISLSFFLHMAFLERSEDHLVWALTEKDKLQENERMGNFCNVISLLFVCIMQAIYEIVEQLPKIMRFSGFNLPSLLPALWIFRLQSVCCW